MFVSGFSFIRNAIRYDYPIVEAITSILPLCDEFVIAVGKSEDDTLELIKGIDSSKIKIIETVWDDTLREGGRVLAVETDKALSASSEQADWCFYIQGDEVMHEKYLEPVGQAMRRYKDDERVDGLLFDYKHFYGSYDYVGTSYRWYQKEIRIVRRNPGIYSHLDAQGFRKGNNEKLRVMPSGGTIYHYGWVKDPRAMQRKQEAFHRLWHSDEWVEKNIARSTIFDYSNIDALKRFEASHPKVMEERIARINWHFDYDISYNSLKFKDRFRRWLEKHLGIRIGVRKNYKLL